MNRQKGEKHEQHNQGSNVSEETLKFFGLSKEARSNGKEKEGRKEEGGNYGKENRDGSMQQIRWS